MNKSADTNRRVLVIQAKKKRHKPNKKKPKTNPTNNNDTSSEFISNQSAGELVVRVCG